MKAAADFLINVDQKLYPLWSCSPIFSRRSARGIVIRMVEYYYYPGSSNTSISLSSSLCSSSSTATHITHRLPLSKSHQEGSGIEATGLSKSVNVKFQMKKECQFGDHILMVGDDPLLGSWSPLNAIPFNWSEGHLWTLVLEMPVDKAFKYKFLLKKSSGEMLWQPGPDRVFTSWETENLIVVSEEWGTAEAQKIIEQRIIDENEDVICKTVVDDPMPIVAENIIVSVSDESADAPEDCSETIQRNRSVPNVKTGAHSEANPSPSATKKAGTSAHKNPKRRKPTRKDSQRGVRVEQSGSIEAEGSLVTSDEGPVLVPGLTVMLADSEKESDNEHQNSIPADPDPDPRVETSMNEEYYVYRFD